MFKEKEENYENLKTKIVSLRKELKKTTYQLNRGLKFGKIVEILDNILKCQDSTLIKVGLGYNKKQKIPKGYASTQVPK